MPDGVGAWIAHHRGPNTRRTYARRFRVWSRYCRERGRHPLTAAALGDAFARQLETAPTLVRVRGGAYGDGAERRAVLRRGHVPRWPGPRCPHRPPRQPLVRYPVGSRECPSLGLTVLSQVGTARRHGRPERIMMVLQDSRRTVMISTSNHTPATVKPLVGSMLCDHRLTGTHGISHTTGPASTPVSPTWSRSSTAPNASSPSWSAPLRRPLLGCVRAIGSNGPIHGSSRPAHPVSATPETSTVRTGRVPRDLRTRGGLCRRLSTPSPATWAGTTSRRAEEPGTGLSAFGRCPYRRTSGRPGSRVRMGRPALHVRHARPRRSPWCHPMRKRARVRVRVVRRCSPPHPPGRRRQPHLVAAAGVAISQGHWVQQVRPVAGRV
ncbi:hypothetical protein FB465_7126 [Kitasatospora atroaurantiaca]|uniref:Uncharacterized protein n=1 Tax=Kitasatospora atroaurantiaca TaxID=285545 RepID=A0A561F200_9ACTN|nr:hypothetical protein FB465_7126 [Kitasatospora atroaurantiaca]